jgi:hypothetical protein
MREREREGPSAEEEDKLTLIFISEPSGKFWRLKCCSALKDPRLGSPFFIADCDNSFN